MNLNANTPLSLTALRDGQRRGRVLALLVLILLLPLLSVRTARPAVAQTGTVLVPGWNNILYTGASGPISVALAPILDQFIAALHWDASAQRWQVYFPPAPNGSDFDSVQQGQVYWIAVQQPVLLPQANMVAAPVPLDQGWNNVAYMANGDAASTMIASSPVWAWDASVQRWLYRNPAALEISDFSALTPGRAYWLYNGATTPTPAASRTAIATVTPSPSPAAAVCYPFTSLQPTLLQADDALTRAALGTLESDPMFAMPPLRTGTDASSPVQPASIPPTLLRAVAWVETNWHQALYSTSRGTTGPTLTSSTCAYGVMQILTGMQVQGTPTPKQLSIGTDFQANAAAAVQILATEWNRDPTDLPYLGRHDPRILEDWYFSVWAYHCFGSACEGYGAHNNPDDPALPWPRPAYNSPAQLASQSSFDYSSYPYQELVFGVVANPPISNGQPLWTPIPVQLPPHGAIGYPTPQGVGEPSAHLDDGTALPVYPPSATPLQPPTTPAPSGTPAPASTPAPVLVPPSSPPRSP